MEHFKQGHTIYGFDLTPDMCTGPHVHPHKYGALRLEAHFSEPLTTPVNVILYAEFDNLIQIDKARNIVTDFGST
jgi:hypothetical protein